MTFKNYLWPALLVCGIGLFGQKLARIPSVLEHYFHDQHSLQAQAWLKGRADVSVREAHLELVEFNGKIYSSFPPVPALTEIPWVLLFGRETPNHLSLLLYLAFGAALLTYLGLKAGWSPSRSALVAITFTAGSNLLPVTVQSGVWAQGQVVGFVLAIVSLALILGPHTRRQGRAGLLFLALATGCRPFYLFYFPFWILIDRKSRLDGERPAPGIRPLFEDILFGAAPVLVGLAAFNLIRFGNPIEFGHRYLSWSREVSHGIFSFHYLPFNMEHTFIHLPKLIHGKNGVPPIEFHQQGTAFWINNPVFLFALALVGVKRLPKKENWFFWLTLVAVWLPLLMHESNGNAQFGYRYLIDLFPLVLAGLFLVTKNEDIEPLDWVPLLAYSVFVNLYGAYWFHALKMAG